MSDADSGRLSGKVALVSGAARGMGASHARAIVRNGGRVVIGDVLEPDLRELAAELGDAARFLELDVREPPAWSAAVELAESAFGRLDVLVNNAGVLRRSDVESTSADEWKLVMDINAGGVFLGMKTAAPAIRRAGGGSIINISSTAGLRGYPAAFAYGASKWAVRGMTKSAAADLAPDRIRVNSIHPGHILTPMSGSFDDVSTIPFKRAGRSEEISEIVVFLASNESEFCTGAEFLADGGETNIAL